MRTKFKNKTLRKAFITFVKKKNVILFIFDLINATYKIK